MRKLGILLCLILTFCLTTTSQTVVATEKTVRVAFLPEMYGFYEILGNDSYSGYNYEYLMNVSQHTGWNYDFIVLEEGTVSASLAKAEEMMLAGELDLLGPYSLTSPHFEDFETGQRNYGIYRYNFYSGIHNSGLSQDNYFLKDVLRVALVEYYTDLNEQFFHLMEYRGYDLDITYVQTHAETIDLLLNEKVDTILNLDMSSHSEYLNYLTTVQRIPFYFASTKGNTELMAELDEAIRKIEMLEPDIHQRLLDTYFGISYGGDFIFTDQELQSLSGHDSFNVGFLENVPPYQYINDDGELVGITIDLLKKLEEILGIPFQAHSYESLEDLAQAISTTEIDMIGTLSNNYTLSKSLGVTLTIPYTSDGVYWLSHVDETGNSPAMYHYVSDDIPFYSRNELTMVWDIKGALDTMDKSPSISVVCDPYITNYYLSRYNYENIQVKAVSDVLNELTFGVGNHMDENLMSMINRAISYIDASDLDEINFHHTNVSPDYNIWSILNDHVWEIYMGLVVLSTIIIYSICNTSRNFRELSRRDSLTKLYNSGYFHDYTTEKIKKLHHGVLILIDIDYFKDVNDTHGHQIGDAIIKLLARNLEKIYNTQATVARLGGDEFTVLIEGKIEKPELEEKARELLKSMAVNDVNIPTTLSIGGFIFENATHYEQLFKDTDKVLYGVKDEGRNGFHFVTQVEELQPTVTFDHTLTHEVFMKKANHVLTNATPEACHALLSLRIENIDAIEESQQYEFFQEVSLRLKTQVRRYDFVCYRNHNDYLIFLDSCGNEEHVIECEQRIITALMEKYKTIPKELKIEGNITFALYPKQGKTYKELYDFLQNISKSN